MWSGLKKHSTNKPYSRIGITILIIFIAYVVACVWYNVKAKPISSHKTIQSTSLDSKSSPPNSSKIKKKPQVSKNNTSNTSATNSYKAYVSPVCTKATIPYKTTYKYVSYLSAGETQSYGGVDGWTQSCTADSTGYKPADITDPPYNKTVYIGTGKAPSSTYSSSSSYSPRYSQAEATRLAQQNCNAILGVHGAADSSAMQPCIEAELHQFGY